jgi:hypothetical protein
MRQFGDGFGFSLLIGGAKELSEGLRMGAGVAYQYITKYTPYESSTVVHPVTNDTTVISFEGYDPGDAFSVNGGLNYERGVMLWSIDLIYSQYMADELHDVKTFRQSRQFDWRFSAAHSGEKTSFTGLARYVWRGKNRVYDEAGQWRETLQLFGNEIQLAGDLTYMLNDIWYAVPSVDVRLLPATVVKEATGEVPEVRREGSDVLGFGAAVGRRLGESMNARLSFKMYRIEAGHPRAGRGDGHPAGMFRESSQRSDPRFR